MFDRTDQTGGGVGGNEAHTDQVDLAGARAVKAARRDGDVLVAAFDGTPELLQAITDGSIVGSGMQQPYLMGGTAAKLLTAKLSGGNPPKEEMVEIMTVTKETAVSKAAQIKLNVFANNP